MSKRYLIASAALHALLILPLLMHAAAGTGKDKEDQAQQGAAGADRQGNILPKSESGEPSPPQEVSLIILKKPKPKHKDRADSVKNCKGDQWYGGIGIVQSFYLDKVVEIAPGYPADRAGLKVGDRVLSGQLIRGEPGSTMTLLIDRAGAVLSFEITREKICLDR